MSFRRRRQSRWTYNPGTRNFRPRTSNAFSSCRECPASVGNGESNSSVKIAERTSEEGTEALHCTAEEKVAILRRHLVDKVAVSELYEELNLRPTVFYRWQKEFFENGGSAPDTKTMMYLGADYQTGCANDRGFGRSYFYNFRNSRRHAK